MRTTLTIDDVTHDRLKKRAFETGRSFRDVVNEVLRAGLDERRHEGRGKRYRLDPVSLGAIRADLNIDKALQIAAELENEELGRKFELRK